MEIIFYGQARGGADRFSDETVLPKKIEELEIVIGQPSSFERGTFNIQIDESKWPTQEGLDFTNNNQGVRSMDRNSNFKSVAYLPYTEIPDNTIQPNEQNYGPNGGDLQFWPAKLKIESVDEVINCYMFRRVGSNYRNKIEVISDIHIRNKYGLNHGVKVELAVYDCAP